MIFSLLTFGIGFASLLFFRLIFRCAHLHEERKSECMYVYSFRRSHVCMLYPTFQCLYNIYCASSLLKTKGPIWSQTNRAHALESGAELAKKTTGKEERNIIVPTNLHAPPK